MKNYFKFFQHHETPEIISILFSEMLVYNLRKFINFCFSPT